VSLARRGSEEKIVSDLSSRSSLVSMVSVQWRIKKFVIERC